MWIKENDEEQLKEKADVETSRLMNVLKTFGGWTANPAIPAISTRNMISSSGANRPNQIDKETWWKKGNVKTDHDKRVSWQILDAGQNIQSSL